MGGPGKPGTTTPEHLFAAGYAACFGGALDFVGKQHKKDASKPASPPTYRSDRATAAASGWRKSCASKIDFPQAEHAALAKEAHEKICPYSHATRGNVECRSR